MPFRYWLIIALIVLTALDLMPFWFGMVLFFVIVWYMIKALVEGEDDEW